MTAPSREELETALHLARSKAISDYNSLEMSQCRLFAAGLGTPLEYAGIVFFRIASARTRSRILEALLKKRLGAGYVGEFWNSLFKAINVLDERRNEIVHWQIEVEVTDAAQSVFLIPANVFGLNPANKRWDPARLGEFSVECDFHVRLINMFWGLVFEQNAAPDATPPPWHDIFQQALVYPPPNSHPLSPNFAAP
jgi:hypothetical protein